MHETNREALRRQLPAKLRQWRAEAEAARSAGNTAEAQRLWDLVRRWEYHAKRLGDVLSPPAASLRPTTPQTLRALWRGVWSARWNDETRWGCYWLWYRGRLSVAIYAGWVRLQMDEPSAP